MHDIITIGASAGGVEALVELVQGLPADLPAAVFVVLHTSPRSRSHLAAILSRHGELPATEARHGQAIQAGHILVAPPDHHLLVRNGYVELSRGPRENNLRPAVDPLFRSAARAYGPRVVGVVLSGALSDGAMGLLAIASRGGVTVVQDPDDALVEGMPRAAVNNVHVDHILPVAKMPALLMSLALKPIPEKGGWLMVDEADEPGAALVRRDIQAQARGERAGETTVFTCPECGGTLWQIDENGLVQFNCHTGHTYGAEILLGQMSEELESALWRCVRLLTEKATLTRQLSNRLHVAGHKERAQRLAEEALDDDRHGRLIHNLLLEGTANVADDAVDASS